MDVGFWQKGDWSQGSCHGNVTTGVILWCTILVPNILLSIGTSRSKTFNPFKKIFKYLSIHRHLERLDFHSIFCQKPGHFICQDYFLSFFYFVHVLFSTSFVKLEIKFEKSKHEVGKIHAENFQCNLQTSSLLCCSRQLSEIYHFSEYRSSILYCKCKPLSEPFPWYL